MSNTFHKFIVEAYSETELLLLCGDSEEFQLVTAEFGDSMSRNEKVRRLIAFCKRHGLYKALWEKVKNERKKLWIAQGMPDDDPEFEVIHEPSVHSQTAYTPQENQKQQYTPPPISTFKSQPRQASPKIETLPYTPPVARPTSHTKPLVLPKFPLPFWLLIALVIPILFALVMIRPINPSGIETPLSTIRNFDVDTVPYLEDAAHETPVKRPEPGKTYTYSIPLPGPKRLRWGYSWCASTQPLLEENLSQIQFTFIDQNNQSISSNQFSVSDYVTYDPKQNQVFCRSYYRDVAENWPDGQYRLLTDVTFLTSINDGQDTYPSGVVHYIYNLQIGPSVVVTP